MASIDQVAGGRDLPSGQPLLEDPAEIGRQFNKHPFSFTHNLAGHSLFALPRLKKLAAFLMQQDGDRTVRWQTSNAPIESGWKISYEDMSGLSEAIESIEQSGSWVLLYSVQRDPEYRALLDQLMAEIIAATGVSHDEITWEDAYIFMSSPQSLTPYHIDHEATFLFQVHGSRRARIWDANDRDVLSDLEIESYYAGDFSAATYRPENDSKAYVFALTPGKGVHHPCRAPHSFNNGEVYSVALGVHFCIRSVDRQAGAYQINHYLRQLGLNPKSPGTSRWQDNIKMSTISALSSRNPANKDELLRSGIRRLTYPIKVLRDLKSSVSGTKSTETK